ncbi:hypothetical protein IT97_00245 [Listeria monocytogenes]|uniref:DUF1642 domain-containing protein n=1 Tax=Listeria monocytogenes TaxID=1639 RepID=UPI0010D5164D|nr:DUF1642 domain-containing protein [Listeria monocytogenes]EAC8432166.1 hypothetical protein [Listeria monocytogenes]
MCEFCKAEVNQRNAVINGSRDKMSLDKDNELEIVVNVNSRALYDYFSILYCPLCGRSLEGRQMKKITQEYVEGVKDYNGLTVIKAPVVSEAVADWFEENKNDLGLEIWMYIYNFNKHKNECDSFCMFMNDKSGKQLETLVFMQYGYYVQKEVSE